MKKPLIGIVGKPSIEVDMWHYMEIVDDIRFVLIKNNALAVGLLPTDKKLNFKIDEEIDNYTLTDDEPKLDNKYPGHCGIYLGDKKFIQASYPKGKVVISDFDNNPYWIKV